MFRDDPALELEITQPHNLPLLAILREKMCIAWKLLHQGASGYDAIIEQAKTVLDMLDTMKRRARSASFVWDTFLRLARST